MKNTSRMLWVALLTFSTMSCSLKQSHEDRTPSSIIEAGNYDLKALTDDQVLALSSSENLKVEDLKIITDNTEALESKVDIIRKARSEIVMMYYIFGTDESSSYLTQELLKAADRNVKVRILVDFFVNYKNYDYFKMLEEKSHGNIQVSFYGVPQGALLESMSYLVSPCEVVDKSCVQKKWSLIEQEHSNNQIPFFTKLLVAGLYTKSPNLVKLALVEGSQVDLGGSTKISDDDKAQLLDFLKLVFKAKVKGSLSAKLKLAMALVFYGDKTLPIYEKLLALFPVTGGNKNLAQYWENSTDFIHHKFIMSDRKYVQLGGRNIEDSYHMAVSPSGKYTFLDTDVYAEVQDGADDLLVAYNKMWNFKDSVKTLKNLDSVTAHDFTVPENLGALTTAIKECEPQKKSPDYGACVERTANANIAVPMSQRMKKAEELLNQMSAAYEARKIAVTNPTSLTLNDPNPFVTYVENLSFTKESNQRLFGANGDKHITELWINAIKNTCLKAAQTKTHQDIMFLNAYVFMPAALFSTIGDALTGKISCPNTTFTIATNSAESTDLMPVNMLATYQFLSLAKYSKLKRGADLRILEMKKISQKTNYSLHSKASIIGDDILIGSANADIRSYHMDSNNGFFIRNTPQLNDQYKQWMRSFIDPASGHFIDKTSVYKNLSFQQAQNINGQVFDNILLKYGGKISKENQSKIKQMLLNVLKDVYDDSQFFLSRRFMSMDERERHRVLKNRTERFDNKYQVF